LQTSFSDLRLAEPLLRALAAEKYLTPTPIQAQAIPPLLAGRDVLGLAQTGTGKTAAFALPILHTLSQHEEARSGRPRALVLTPTRELAIQVAASFRTYGRHLALRCAVVFGGVGQQPQVDALARGVDILVATPGRLLDLAERKAVRFDKLSIFVLDEADRMLDMGFLPDVKRIIALLPKERQTLLFSATMPDSIGRLAASILRQPVRAEVAPSATTVERVDQRIIFVPGSEKPLVLAELLRDPTISRALVFTRTKHGANRVVERLVRAQIHAEAIHGNKSQAARQRALEGFRNGSIRILVATDIAARGIDVDGISHVVNFDIPNEAESYVHRIGRTARAGASGVAIALCDPSERAFVSAIEKLTRLRLRVVERARPVAVAAHTASDPQPRALPGSRPVPAERRGSDGQAAVAQDGGHRRSPRGAGQRSAVDRPLGHRHARRRKLEHRSHAQ
jgi:ATP-dependent RNA helicase RhlE